MLLLNFSVNAQQLLTLSEDTVELEKYSAGALIVVSDNRECSGCMENLGEAIKKIATQKAVIVLDRTLINSQVYRRLRASEVRSYYPAATQFLAAVNDSFLSCYKEMHAPFVLLYKNGRYELISYQSLYRNVSVTSSSKRRIRKFLEKG